MAYNVSSLSTYIKENAEVILKDAILGTAKGDTIEKCRKQLNVKGSEKLHILDVNPALQKGDECGFNASGSTVFTDRTIDTALVRVQDEWCRYDLIEKFAESLVQMKSGAAEIPFEAQITEEVLNGIQKQLEVLAWTGKKSEGIGVDGFVTRADNGGADSGSTKTVALPTGTSVFDAVQAVYMALPENLLNLDDTYIFLSPANFRAYTAELVTKNYFAYPSAINENPDEFVIPGSGVKVKKCYGLEGVNDKIYASSFSNMVVGTDLLGDSSSVTAWYDENTEQFRLNIRFNIGFQVLFPDEVVLGTIAGA